MAFAYLHAAHGITWKLVPRERLRWLLCCDLHDVISVRVDTFRSPQAAAERVARQTTGVRWWDALTPALLPADIADLRSWRKVRYPEGLPRPH